MRRRPHDLCVERSRMVIGPELVADLGSQRPFSVWVAPSGEVAPAGRQVGPYQLLEPLGLGRTGEVWRAVAVDGGPAIAVKVLRRDARASETRARFAREAQILARIRHPAIVRLLDYRTSGDDPYIAMELAGGRTLARHLAEHVRLGPHATGALVAEIARGLDAVHAAGVVHRDVEPCNVALRADGSVKLFDFGLALPPAPAVRLAGIHKLGNVHYASPEQCRDVDAVDAASDVWSLGVLAYQALTGVAPFDGPRIDEVERQIRLAPVPPLGAFAGHLPASLDRVFSRVLAKNPRERFATASEFAAAFQAAIAPAESGPGEAPWRSAVA